MSNYSSYSDKELLPLIQKDDFAFRELYSRYWNTLYQLAKQKCAHVELAEDCVQDVFLSLLQHKHISSIDNVHAYLAKAIKFAIIRSIYRHRRTEYIDKYPEESLFDALSIEDALQEKYLQESILNKIEELPSKTKEIFKQSRIQHISNKEIAQELNISQRTVENQLSKALSHLRKYWAHLSLLMVFFK